MNEQLEKEIQGEKVPSERLIDDSLFASLFLAVISEEGQAMSGQEIRDIAGKDSNVTIDLVINGKSFSAIRFMERLEKHMDESIRKEAVRLVGEDFRDRIIRLNEVLEDCRKEVVSRAARLFDIQLSEMN